MLGDNLYGNEGAKDFEKKFERPYKALLDAGVKFYASLGNHDNPNQRFYKLFNMNGQRYYNFKPKDRNKALRPGQQLHGQGTARVAGKGVARFRRRMEDLFLPPSSVFIGRKAWA